MTQRTSGTSELKYSEETFRDMYEALKLYLAHQEGKRGHYCSICHNEIEKALAKAEVK
ncbi:MAG: hypothetical protein Q8O55_04020 [Dehalococcoidales bacterium]|nr:hypothetical protein [Dehalococcoidales bacterium]